MLSSMRCPEDTSLKQTRQIRVENLTDQESEISDTEGDYISEVEREQPDNSSSHETENCSNDPTPR